MDGAGIETPTDYSVEVFVPLAVPPPAPLGIEVVALDNANYLRWSSNARDAEDFSFYLQKTPGCFVRLGARKADWIAVPLHSPAFDIDERVLAVGTNFLDRVARLGCTWHAGGSDAV